MDKYFTGLFYLLVLVFVLHFSSGEANATTINGDLVVDDNDQTTISSLTYVNGSVIVKDNGVLTIQSTTLQINQTANLTRTFTISDNATVIVTSSTVKSDKVIDISLSDSAILKSNSSSKFYVRNLILEDTSQIRLTDTLVSFKTESALNVTLHLTHFQMIDNIDRDSEGEEDNLAEPYFKLKIDGTSIRVPSSGSLYNNVNDTDIDVSHTVSVSSTDPNIAVHFEAWDKDTTDNDQIDISAVGMDMDLVYDYLNNTWSGDTTGNIANGEDDGSAGEDDDDGKVWFNITDNTHGLILHNSAKAILSNVDLWKDEATVLFQYNNSEISMTNGSSAGFEMIYSWDGGDLSLASSLFQVDGMAVLLSDDLSITGNSRLGWNNTFNLVATTFTMDNSTLGSTSKSSPDEEFWANVTTEVSVRYSHFNVSYIFFSSRNTELFGVDYDIELLNFSATNLMYLNSTTLDSDDIILSAGNLRSRDSTIENFEITATKVYLYQSLLKSSSSNMQIIADDLKIIESSIATNYLFYIDADAIYAVDTYLNASTSSGKLEIHSDSFDLSDSSINVQGDATIDADEIDFDSFSISANHLELITESDFTLDSNSDIEVVSGYLTAGYVKIYDSNVNFSFIEADRFYMYQSKVNYTCEDDLKCGLNVTGSSETKIIESLINFTSETQADILIKGSNIKLIESVVQANSDVASTIEFDASMKLWLTESTVEQFGSDSSITLLCPAYSFSDNVIYSNYNLTIDTDDSFTVSDDSSIYFLYFHLYADDIRFTSATLRGMVNAFSSGDITVYETTFNVTQTNSGQDDPSFVFTADGGKITWTDSTIIINSDDTVLNLSAEYVKITEAGLPQTNILDSDEVIIETLTISNGLSIIDSGAVKIFNSTYNSDFSISSEPRIQVFHYDPEYKNH